MLDFLLPMFSARPAVRRRRPKNGPPRPMRRVAQIEDLEVRAMLAGGSGMAVLLNFADDSSTRDAQMNRDFPTTNFGGSEEIFASYRSASALRWDVGAIPANAVVESVELILNVTNPSKDAYSLYALRRSWTEEGLNWQSASADALWQTAGAEGAGDRGAAALGTLTATTAGLHTIKLNPAGIAEVQSWIRNASVNHGVLLQNYQGADSLGISSREAANIALRPKLVIKYTLPANAAPVVDAGPDQVIALSGIAMLQGNASDDGQPKSTLATSWAKVSGPGSVTFGNSTSLGTTAKFSAVGTYVLRLSAYDGFLISEDEITIQVTEDSWGTVSITTEFQQGRDAQMNRDFPTTNYGASPEIYASHRSASAFSWDLSSIPTNATVNSVQITLNITDQSRDSYEFYALLRNWSEGSLTWRQGTSGGVWQASGALGSADRGADVLGSITALGRGLYTVTLNAKGIAVVQDWIKNPQLNRGLILQDYSGTDSLGISSREAADPNLRPKLTVSYTVPATAPVVSAGPDRAATLPGSAALDGDVKFNGGAALPSTVTTLWTKVSGPGNVTFANAGAIDTTASFSQSGTYVLRLTVSSGQTRLSDEMVVTVADPVASTKGVWISRAELMALPTSGAAWDSLVQAANTTANNPVLSNQSDNTDQYTLAKAMVGVRTGNQALIAQARANIMKAIGTEQGGSTLGFSRNLPGYIIAADLIGLSGADDAKFRSWLRSSLSAVHAGRSIRSTHEDRPNNWGTMAGGARAAIAVYLGDQAELARVAQVFKGWLGDRGSYAGFKYGDLSWQSNPNSPVGINPKGATKNGRSIDGALPEEMRRGGDFQWPPTFTDYSWEALQGAFVQAEILYRAGYDTYQWSDQALLRATKFLYSTIGWPADGDDEWQPWLINARYGTNYAAELDARFGKIMGWTQWTHASPVRAAAQLSAGEWSGLGMTAALNGAARETSEPLPAWEELVPEEQGGSLSTDAVFAQIAPAEKGGDADAIESVLAEEDWLNASLDTALLNDLALAWK